MTPELQAKLISLAKEEQKSAYAPYSKFAVGVAIMTEDGDFFTGCNVENISYGLSICGERAAIFKMVSEKGPQSVIKGIAVTTKADILCAPCGACRQVILEFSTPETMVIYKGEKEYITTPLTQLLPNAFNEVVAVH